MRSMTRRVFKDLESSPEAMWKLCIRALADQSEIGDSVADPDEGGVSEAGTWIYRSTRNQLTQIMHVLDPTKVLTHVSWYACVLNSKLEINAMYYVKLRCFWIGDWLLILITK